MERDSLQNLGTDEESYSSSDEFDSDSSSTDGPRKEQAAKKYINDIMDASPQRAGYLAGAISQSNSRSGGLAGGLGAAIDDAKDGTPVALKSSNRLPDTVWDSPVVPPGSPINGSESFNFRRTAKAGANARLWYPEESKPIKRKGKKRSRSRAAFRARPRPSSSRASQTALHSKLDEVLDDIERNLAPPPAINQQAIYFDGFASFVRGMFRCLRFAAAELPGGPRASASGSGAGAGTASGSPSSRRNGHSSGKSAALEHRYLGLCRLQSRLEAEGGSSSGSEQRVRAVQLTVNDWYVARCMGQERESLALAAARRAQDRRASGRAGAPGRALGGAKVGRPTGAELRAALAAVAREHEQGVHRSVGRPIGGSRRRYPPGAHRSSGPVSRSPSRARARTKEKKRNRGYEKEKETTGPSTGRGRGTELLVATGAALPGGLVPRPEGQGEGGPLLAWWQTLGPRGRAGAPGEWGLRCLEAAGYVGASAAAGSRGEEDGSGDVTSAAGGEALVQRALAAGSEAVSARLGGERYVLLGTGPLGGGRGGHVGRSQWGQGPGPAWIEGLDLGAGPGLPGVAGPEWVEQSEDPMGALLGRGGERGGSGSDRGHAGRSAPVLPAVHAHMQRAGAGTASRPTTRPGSAVPRRGVRPGMPPQRRRARPSSAAGMRGSSSEARISDQHGLHARAGSSSTGSRLRHSRGHRPQTATTARRKVQLLGGLHGPGGLAEKNIRAATRVYGAPVLGGGAGGATDARDGHMNTYRQGPDMPRMPPIGGKRTGAGSRPSSARLPPVAGGQATAPGGTQTSLGYRVRPQSAVHRGRPERVAGGRVALGARRVESEAAGAAAPDPVAAIASMAWAREQELREKEARGRITLKPVSARMRAKRGNNPGNNAGNSARTKAFDSPVVPNGSRTVHGAQPRGARAGQASSTSGCTASVAAVVPAVDGATGRAAIERQVEALRNKLKARGRAVQQHGENASAKAGRVMSVGESAGGQGKRQGQGQGHGEMLAIEEEEDEDLLPAAATKEVTLFPRVGGVAGAVVDGGPDSGSVQEVDEDEDEDDLELDDGFEDPF